MICRRCGESIADGSDTCPVCGISQHTYITPRNYNAIRSAPAKKMPRGTFVSIVAIAVSIAAVAGFYFLGGWMSEGKEFTAIQEAYERRDADKLELASHQFLTKHSKSESFDEVMAYYSEAKDFQEIKTAYQERDANKLDFAARQFTTRYPESVFFDDILDYYKELIYGEADAEHVGSTPEEVFEYFARSQEELLERLKRTARDEIMRVESIGMPELVTNDERGVTISWRNMSKKDIKEVIFVVEARDENGNKVGASAKGESALALTENKFTAPNGAADTPYASFWLGVWKDGRVDHVVLTGVKITYDDGASVSLPQSVCDLITG